MGYQQHMDSIDDANRLPSKLTVRFPVLPGQLIRIIKDQGCRFETDAVPSSVRPVLAFVPDELHVILV